MAKLKKKTLKSLGLSQKTTDIFLKNLCCVVEGIGLTFGKDCEVVLHDLRHPERSIVAISNGHVSNRKVGGPIIGGPIDDKALKTLYDQASSQSIISNYLTRTYDGRQLRSTSMFFRDDHGTPVIALCINLDLTTIGYARDFLAELCTPGPNNDAIKEACSNPEEGKHAVSEIALKIIDDSIRQLGIHSNQANKSDKLKALRLMHGRGLFLIRGGVFLAAKRLGVSQYTVYNYLKEI